MDKRRIALTVAGTDPTGGAGIMADLKSFHASGVYGMGVATSIVSQNTLGVQDAFHLPASVVASQLESVFSDVQPHAMKSGMIANADMMRVVRDYVQQQNAPYVVDPVMVAKSGHDLMDHKGKQDLQHILLPLATVVTPNIPEAEEITGMRIETEADVYRAGHFFINEVGVEAVVMKGGHRKGDAEDILITRNHSRVWRSERFDTPHTHGTGCTFSAVLTAALARGYTIEQAVDKAKRFITLAIKHTPEIGHGQGPVNHFVFQNLEES